MSDQVLFYSPLGDVTEASLRDALLRVKADCSDILYIHSGLSFGHPDSTLPRRDLLARIVDVLLSLEVSTICMPTFTFSFCNGENFHHLRSKSRMGALNEFVRLHPLAQRSLDPLMSVSIIGTNTELVADLGTESVGEASTFQRLETSGNTRFLFFGVELGDCFTHMHYLEWKAKVPYRYNRRFTGIVDDGNTQQEVTQTLFVRYNGVTPNTNSYRYQQLLLDQGILEKTGLGSGLVSSISLSDAEPLYLELLADDPNFFISQPFDRELVTTDFVVDKMVAL